MAGKFISAKEAYMVDFLRSQTEMTEAAKEMVIGIIVLSLFMLVWV